MVESINREKQISERIDVMQPEAKAFVLQFFRDRQIITEFYKLVPEDKLDYRMVDTAKVKSDSPRESLAHIIGTTRDYTNGAKNGILQFGVVYEDLAEPSELSKEKLMEMLAQSEDDLINVLSDPDIVNRKVKVPWLPEPISAVSSLWGLDSHEILHQGWSLAIMDHLGIERFPALKDMWG